MGKLFLRMGPDSWSDGFDESEVTVIEQATLCPADVPPGFRHVDRRK